MWRSGDVVFDGDDDDDDDDCCDDDIGSSDRFLMAAAVSCVDLGDCKACDSS